MSTFPTDAERWAAELALHNVLNPSDATYAADNVLDALAPLIAARERAAATRALREAKDEILAAVGPVVPHKGGSAGVYTNAPNGDSMALWSYGNAVAYTGATIEIVGLIADRADALEAGEDRG